MGGNALEEGCEGPAAAPQRKPTVPGRGKRGGCTAAAKTKVKAEPKVKVEKAKDEDDDTKLKIETARAVWAKSMPGGARV